MYIPTSVTEGFLKNQEVRTQSVHIFLNIQVQTNRVVLSDTRWGRIYQYRRQWFKPDKTTAQEEVEKCQNLEKKVMHHLKLPHLETDES